jgi:hypothetical protein
MHVLAALRRAKPEIARKAMFLDQKSLDGETELPCEQTEVSRPNWPRIACFLHLGRNGRHNRTTEEGILTVAVCIHQAHTRNKFA